MKVKPRWQPEAAHSFWINHASRLLVRAFEQTLRPLDFGFAYLPVVMALAENGPLQQKDIVERSRVEQPTIAALLTRMERDGLIQREAHPTDKRASQISLTAKAKARIPKAKERLTVVASRVTRGFTKHEREVFMDLLRRAVANLTVD